MGLFLSVAALLALVSRNDQRVFYWRVIQVKTTASQAGTWGGHGDQCAPEAGDCQGESECRTLSRESRVASTTRSLIAQKLRVRERCRIDREYSQGREDKRLAKASPLGSTPGLRHGVKGVIPVRREVVTSSRCFRFILGSCPIADSCSLCTQSDVARGHAE